MRNRLLRLAAFQNPEFYQAQALRLSTYGTPRIVACAEDFPKHIGLPRGCLDEVLRTLGELGIDAVTRDERCRGQPLAVSFQGQLRPEQQAAAKAMLAHDTGVLAAYDGVRLDIQHRPDPDCVASFRQGQEISQAGRHARRYAGAVSVVGSTEYDCWRTPWAERAV